VKFETQTFSSTAQSINPEPTSEMMFTTNIQHIRRGEKH